MSQDKPIDLRRPAKAILVDVINQSNPNRNFSVDDIEFGTPRPRAGTDKHDATENDTWVDAIVRNGDPQPINYGRVDIGAREGVRGVLRIAYAGQMTVSDLLHDFNDAAQMLLTTDDIFNPALEGLTAESLPYSLQIRARPESLIAIGQVNAVIVDPAELEDAPTPPDVDLTARAVLADVSVHGPEGAPKVGTETVINIEFEYEGNLASDTAHIAEVTLTGAEVVSYINNTSRLNITGATGSNKAQITLQPGLVAGKYTAAIRMLLKDTAVNVAVKVESFDVDLDLAVTPLTPATLTRFTALASEMEVLDGQPVDFSVALVLDGDGGFAADTRLIEVDLEGLVPNMGAVTAPEQIKVSTVEGKLVFTADAGYVPGTGLEIAFTATVNVPEVIPEPAEPPADGEEPEPTPDPEPRVATATFVGAGDTQVLEISVI